MEKCGKSYQTPDDLARARDLKKLKYKKKLATEQIQWTTPISQRRYPHQLGNLPIKQLNKAALLQLLTEECN
jgi:hypothetical protein